MNLMKHIINRRKYLGLFGCGCCSLILPSCATVPITERRQLSIIPEATINNQAAVADERFKDKAKLITKGKQLNEIRDIGKKIEFSVKSFFTKRPNNNTGIIFEKFLNKSLKKFIEYQR